ncbi:hypothetical protein ACUV78_001219 [Enterobacter kobei]
MSTITKEFTKEQLQQIIETDHVQCGEASALARIALASLEAEAVCVIDQSNLDYLKSGADADVWPASRKEMGDVLLYRTAPPAPANAEPVAWLWSHRKHPSEVSLIRPEDDERAEGAHWSGWSCQALYAAPPAPVSVPDGYRLQPISEYDAMCAAMLQGADGNSPVIPDGLRLALSNAGIAAPESDEMLAATCEKCIQALVTWVKERKPFRSAVIPDGWVMMPVEPTEEMLDEFDSIIDYGAEDSKDAWSRLIAAAPQQEVKS